MNPVAKRLFRPLRFTAADADAAADQWGMNCGPGAIAAVVGLSLTELRPLLGDFEQKRYTNPSLMWLILSRLCIGWNRVHAPRTWPRYGLARVQWEGPWTAPGVPAAAAYRHTHWVGANSADPRDVGIFDINCMSSGGWVPAEAWAGSVVPWLLKECEPHANGRWHLTHAAEITTAVPRRADGSLWLKADG